ncbi:unnamed protein product [Ranitomeya imitator]|uniref:Uncharacterized protein n=1 Tax=Ranitomeya imitator TaxID=111125 RepID=A0ABN9KRX5_9NEOB|nr:unnamed protein product [Ranitomeya imitator]
MSSETFFNNADETAKINSKVTASGEFLHTSTQELKNRDLERETKRVINLELHTITIAEYLRVQLIPMGLQVPLQPTFFKDDKEYCSKFEHILNKCSFDLMTLTLAHLQKNLDTVNTQISTIENQLASTLMQEEFQAFKAKNPETLQVHWQELEKKKRSKFLRDTEDYLQNRVYQWRDKQCSFRRHSSPSSSGSADSRTGSTNSTSTGATDAGQKEDEVGGQCRQGHRDTSDNQIPAYRFNFFELNLDLQRFFCNLRLKAHFQGVPDTTTLHSNSALLQLKGLGLRTPSTFMPPRNNPHIETFISLVERDMEIFNREVNQGKFQHQTNLTHMEKLALDELSTDKSLIIKPADKGGAIVVMDKTYYMSEIQRKVSDTQVYEPIPHNPINNKATKILAVVDHHFEEGIIDKKLRNYLIKNDPITPVFYVLPKIHKNLHRPPGRPIVSSTDSILSPLAITLEKILTPLTKQTRSFLLDTNEFLKLIKYLGPLSTSTILATWDVSSLYTSITHIKGIEATNRLLTEANVDPKVRRFCSDILNLVLWENYLLFQDTFYVQ